jgi:hypothetical protein
MDDEFLRSIRGQQQGFRPLRHVRGNHASVARTLELASGIDTTDRQRVDSALVAPREAGRA